MEVNRWYQLAQEAIDDEKYHEAKDLLNNVIQLDGTFLQAYHDLVVVLIHQGDFEGALQLYKQIEKMDDTSDTVLKHAALLLFLDQPVQAQQKFQLLLQQLHPEEEFYTDALKGLGDSYFRQANFRQAQETYDILLERDPDNAFIWYSKAEAYYRAQAHEQAFDAIEKAIELEYRPEFFAFKGDFFIRHDNYEKALEQYRLAANLAPQDNEIKLRLGFILRIVKRPQDALEIFDQVLQLDAYATEALENKIEIYQELGNLPAARAATEQLVRLHPDNWKLGLEVVHNYMENGGFERAVQLLELMIKPNYEVAEIWYELASCLLELQEYQRAEQAILKVQEFGKDEIEMYQKLHEKIEKKLQEEAKKD